MKFLNNSLIASAVILCANCAFAETYYFTNTVEKNPSGSNNSWNTTGAWTDSQGTVTPSGVYPKATDDVVFSKDYLPGGGRDCVVNAGSQVNDFTITNGYSANMAQGNNSTLTINGNLYKYYGTGTNAGSTQSAFTYSGAGGHDINQAAKVVVKGNVVVGEADENGKFTINGGTLKFGGNGDLARLWGAALGQVTIGGNIEVNYRSRIVFNVANDYDGTSYASVMDYAKDKLLDPNLQANVKVAGKIVCYGGQKESEQWWGNGDLVLFERVDSGVQGGLAIIEANGIQNTFNAITTNVNSGVTTDSIAVLRLVNDAATNLSTNSWIYDGGYDLLPKEGYKAKVMIQMAGLGSQKFAGERFIITGGIHMVSGTLQVNMSNSTNALEFSRGDITLYGGKFGSLLDGEKNKGQSDMLFTTLDYSDGTVMFYVANGSSDKFTLSNTLIKGEGFTGAMNFELSGDLSTIVGHWTQILKWDNLVNQTDFLESEFVANTYVDNGITYEAEFDIRDDGLWVQYVQAVPEPATVAVVIGALALGLGVLRRKNK